jgi:ubiquinone/menaquinone biosynthesis C-methylase UbiE
VETTAAKRKADHPIISEIGAASFLVPVRKDQAELLDQNVGTSGDVRTNLMEMWRMNRYFGGIGALTHHLYPLLRQSTQPVRVIDIGTGSGEMAILLAQWAKQNGLRILIGALDKSERNLSVAHENTKTIRDISTLQADACMLPLAENQVDYFISSLFLHHLSPDQVITVLRESYKCSRCGIVMSDLVRGYLPLVGFQLIQPVFARHYLTKHDGRLSIRRAYTANELRILAHAAGLETARVYSHFPWRMTLVAEKSRV